LSTIFDIQTKQNQMERDKTKKESKTKKDQSKEKGSYLFFFSIFLIRIVTGCACRDVVLRRGRLLSCLLCEVWCVGKVFGFNHKIMINVQELLHSIMITRNLWSARVWVRDWLCKGKTHHPQCTLPKISYIVV
jgi:hypothetical protein